MKTSSISEVKDMYDETADSYARMMDAEIELPMFADILSRLSQRIVDIPGALIDTSCGSGHMMWLYWSRYDSTRPLIGTDLSPKMVEITKRRLGENAVVILGDMRNLEGIPPASAAAVISFFSLHHLDPKEAFLAFKKWHETLNDGGQLVVALWEGQGAIDYGDQSEIVALRYCQREVETWATEAGFTIERCVVEPVEDFPMDAIYLEATKQQVIYS